MRFSNCVFRFYWSKSTEIDKTKGYNTLAVFSQNGPFLRQTLKPYKLSLDYPMSKLKHTSNSFLKSLSNYVFRFRFCNWWKLLASFPGLTFLAVMSSTIRKQYNKTRWDEAAKKEMNVQLRKSKAWLAKLRDPQEILWTWAICSPQSWSKIEPTLLPTG